MREGRTRRGRAAGLAASSLLAALAPICCQPATMRVLPEAAAGAEALILVDLDDPDLCSTESGRDHFGLRLWTPASSLDTTALRDARLLLMIYRPLPLALSGRGPPGARLDCDPAGALLPSAQALFATSEGAEGWEELAELPPAVASVRITPTSTRTCVSSLDRKRVVLPNAGHFRFAIALDEQSGLVGTTAGEVWIVRHDADPSLLLPTSSVGWTAGSRAGTGEIWLARRDGWLAEVDPVAKRVLRMVPPPIDAVPGAIAVPRTGPADEIFLVATDGRLARLTAQGIERFDEGRLADPLRLQWARVVWLAPGEALFTRELEPDGASTRMVRYERGAWVAEAVDDAVAVVAAAWIPPWGPVVAGPDAVGHRWVYARSSAGGGWTHLWDPMTPTGHVHGVTGFGDGQVAVGVSGIVRQWSPSRLCPEPSNLEFQHLAVLSFPGDRLLIAGNGGVPELRYAVVNWLFPRAE